MRKGLYIISGVLLMLILWGTLFHCNTRRVGCGEWLDIEGKRIFGPTIDIPPEVIHVENHDTFIIIKQLPLKTPEEAVYERTYTYPAGRDSTYYWIIYKKNHRYHGPMLYDEYLQIRKYIKL